MNEEILKDAVERARTGEITFLLFRHFDAARCYAEEPPKDMKFNITNLWWRHSSGGGVMFRSVSMPAEYFYGTNAHIRFMDGAVEIASQRTIDVVVERNAVYEARRQMLDYYKTHKVCPECLRVPSCSTYVGFAVPPDTNEVRCECGWCGTVDELTSECEAK